MGLRYSKVLSNIQTTGNSSSTDLQSDTDDVEGLFNLRMLSPVSQLLAHPDAQTTQSHAPNTPHAALHTSRVEENTRETHADQTLMYLERVNMPSPNIYLVYLNEFTK